MRKPRVAVLYSHALFGRGIAQLLQADKQLDVTCLSASLAEASEELKRLRPDAIVVEGCAEDDLLRDVIRDLPPALFIGVHPKDDVMDVYYGRQVVTARPESLAEAIHLGLKRRGTASPLARSD